VHVLGTRIWCDAARARGLTFVSGADVKLLRPSEKLLATERTQKLARLRGDVLPAPFARPFALGRARLELLPAGRVPGSAQLRVELDGRTLIYAGAIGASPLAEPAQVRGCDVLVLAPAPSLREPEAMLAAARAGGELVAPDAFVGVEIVALLRRSGIAPRVHRSIARLINAYARLGVAIDTVTHGTAAAGVATVTIGRANVALAVDVAAQLEHAAATCARDVHLVAAASDQGELMRALTKRQKKSARVHALGPPVQIGLFR
jgi:hypothetical protein